MNSKARSHYEVLEVSRDASIETIRAAHSSLVERTRQVGASAEASERIRQLDTAFAVLSDPRLRNQYDEAIAAPTRTTPASAMLEDRTQAEAFYKRPREELAKAAFDAGDWAGFWRRLAAVWLDGMIVYYGGALLLGLTIGVVTGSRPNSDSAVGWIFGLGMCLIPLAYHSLFIGSRQYATLGRQAFGIAVVDSRTGANIGRARALLRSLLSLLSYLIVLPDLVVIFTRRKQSVADLLTKTAVVRYRGGSSGVLVAVICVIVGVAFIGILAAIAIPQYQSYVIRAQVAEVRRDLSSYSKLVEMQLRQTGGVPASLDGLGYSPISKSTAYTIAESGVLIAQLQTGGKTTATIALRPKYSRAADELTWTCISDGFNDATRPKDCPQYRNQQGK